MLRCVLILRGSSGYCGVFCIFQASIAGRVEMVVGKGERGVCKIELSGNNGSAVDKVVDNDYFNGK